MAVHYDLCGWRVASEIPLPDLPLWQGTPGEPDIAIRLGPVAAIDRPILKTPLVQIDGERRARFGVAGVADYLVENGDSITIDPQLPIDAAEIRLFLLGSGFGFLCHQRGVLPLHAATVEIDGEAVSFAGSSGAGKSTLAAAFWRRGHRVLSDDVSPIDADGAILPSFTRIRLWSDSIDHAGWQASEMERCRAGLEKFSRSIAGGDRAKPLRPRAIFHLRRQPDSFGGIRFNRLRGRAAATEFRSQIYRWRSLVGITGKAAATARSVTAAGRFQQHFIAERPVSYDRLDGFIDDIIATVRAAR